MVLMLYRADYYEADSIEPGIAEVFVARNVHYPIGQVWVAFDGSCSRFDDLPEGSLLGL